MIIKLTIPDLADSLVGSLENTIQKLDKEIVDLNESYLNLIDELNNTISIKDSEISNLNSEIDKLSKTQFPDIDGISFAYSKFEGDLPPSIVEYLNTHNLGIGYALYEVTCNSLPDKHLKLNFNTYYNALYQFGVRDLLDNELTIDCSRLNSNDLILLHTVLKSSTFNKINVVNSSKIFRYVDTFLIGSECEVRGLDFAGVTSVSNPFKLTNWVFKVYCDNIGMLSANTSLSFKECVRWGVTVEGYSSSIGAKESLIYSLIDHSFDRASAGYPTCTISLYSYTKEVLTDEEIALITAKGFTIA